MGKELEYEIWDPISSKMSLLKSKKPLLYIVIVRPNVVWSDDYVHGVDDRHYITFGREDYPILMIGKSEIGLKGLFQQETATFNLDIFHEIFERLPFLEEMSIKQQQFWLLNNILLVYHISSLSTIDAKYKDVCSEFSPMKSLSAQALYQVNQMSFLQGAGVDKNRYFNNENEMSFGKAIKTCYSKMFDFTGRASRREYWYFQLYQLLGGVILSLNYICSADEVSMNINAVVLWLFGVINIFPNLSVGWRRMHDIGSAGIWSIYPEIISVIYLIWSTVFQYDTDSKFNFTEFKLSWLFWIALFGWFISACSPSTPSNEYGEPAEQ